MKKKLKQGEMLKKYIAVIIILSMISTYLTFIPELKTSVAKSNQTNASNSESGQVVREPVLLPGMTAIHWENGEEKELKQPFLHLNDWYNYSNQRWANAKTKDGSYWVWVPIFAYKIIYYTDASKSTVKGYSEQNHFKNALNEDAPDPDTIKSNYMDIDIKFIGSDTNTVPENYRLHPAFTNKGDKILSSGFWVAKYKASDNNGDLEFKPNKEMKTNISVSDAFSKADRLALNESKYGLSKVFVKSSMPKNSDLAAVLYLATSNKGINKSTVSFKEGTVTGNENENSSTGNETGVFDLNREVSEWTASYINNGSQVLTENAEALMPELTTPIAEKDIEQSDKIELYPFKAGNDTEDGNTKEIKRQRNIFQGDGIYEMTYKAGEQYKALGEGISKYPYQDSPVIIRGGSATEENTNTSMYSYKGDSGAANSKVGFRTILSPYLRQRSDMATVTLTTKKGTIFDKTNNRDTKAVSVTYSKTKGYPINKEYEVIYNGKHYDKWTKEFSGIPLYEDVQTEAIIDDETDQTDQTDENNDNETYQAVFKDAVTADTYGATNVRAGEKAAEFAKSLTLSKSGYEFVGWNPNPETKEITANTTFYANWRKAQNSSVEHTVKFVANGNIFDTQQIPNKGYATAPVSSPVKQGYNFTGWNPDPEVTIINSDTTFNAMFDRIDSSENEEEITLTIDLSGGSSDSLPDGSTFIVKKGTTLRSEENKNILSKLQNAHPTKKGYTFEKWTLGSLGQGKTFVRDTNIVAKWVVDNSSSDDSNVNNDQENDKETVTVTVNLDGGTSDSLPNGTKFTVKKGTTLRSKENEEFLTKLQNSNPTKDGYTFNQWSVGSLGKGKTFVKNTSIVALWTEAPSSSNDTESDKVTITVDLDGGTSSKIQDGTKYKLKKGTRLDEATFKKYSSILYSAGITKPGYRISKVHISPLGKGKILDRDATLKVIWEKTDMIKVSFVRKNEAGQILSIYKKVEINKNKTPSSIKPKDPYVNGYSFVGWSPDTNKLYNRDVEFVANFEKNNESDFKIITIELDLNGGSMFANMKRTYKILKNTNLPKIDEPFRKGYVFVGWDGPENINGVLTKSARYVAKWKKEKESTDVFDSFLNEKENKNDSDVNQKNKPLFGFIDFKEKKPSVKGFDDFAKKAENTNNQNTSSNIADDSNWGYQSNSGYNSDYNESNSNYPEYEYNSRPINNIQREQNRPSLINENQKSEITKNDKQNKVYPHTGSDWKFNFILVVAISALLGYITYMFFKIKDTNPKRN